MMYDYVKFNRAGVPNVVRLSNSTDRQKYENHTLPEEDEAREQTEDNQML
jgi:hypothetical protein